MLNRITCLLIALLMGAAGWSQETAIDNGFNKQDHGFGLGDGFGSMVKTMAIQADGKILAGGYFKTYNAVAANYITRINTDGSIDTNFNKGGVGAYGDVFAIAVQADGKILLGGIISTYNFMPVNNIVRLNADGSYDNTFNTGTGANNQVNAIAVQADGKILVGGMFTTFNGNYVSRFIRLNTDGSFDYTFNAGGSYPGPNGTVTAITIQPDNKILLGGSFSTYNQYSANSFVRLKTDGKVDSTFNVGGAGANSIINKIVLQSDGKIIMGGSFTTYNNITANYIARTNSDGTYDVNFNVDGSGANNSIQSLVLQPDNKIVIAGSFTTYNDSAAQYIVRLNNDGSTDAGISAANVRPNDIVYSLALQTDGKLLAGGNFYKYNDTVVNYIVRLENTGIKDRTFNAGTGANNTVKAITIQPDSMVLIGGDFSNYNGIPCNYFTRINAAGVRDTAFNKNGVGPDNTVSAIALQTDGKILIGGSFKNYNGVAVSTILRLNADGTIDNSFIRPGGLAVGQVFSIIVQTDGKIMVGGFYAATANGTASYITRLNSDGTIDGSFYYGGNVANGIVRTMALQTDGKIVVGGDFPKYGTSSVGYITRINTDGSKDAGFNASGAGADNSVYTITLQTDGKILIGGLFTNYNNTSTKYIARLNTNGTKDASFNSNSLGADLYVYTIALQTDNKILVGGALKNYNGILVNCITRLTAKGAKDSSFNNSGVGANNAINTIALQTDNKAFYAGGSFTAFNGIGRNRIARIFTDSLLYTISGNIITPAKKNIYSATVIVNSDSTVVNTNMYSAKAGNASAATIRVFKMNDVNKTNGITAQDMALIQSHILGKITFNSPYKIIAADVNGDGKVTTLDIVYIKRLILGMDTAFNKSATGEKRLWAFVDSSYAFPDSTSPFPFKDSISFNGLNATKINQTFIGIKLGDVNWDWNPALARMPNRVFINPKKKVEATDNIDQ